MLPPCLLPLTLEREQVAVRLLCELLLAEVGKRRAGVFGGASGGVCGGASGVVVPFRSRRGKARKAA